MPPHDYYKPTMLPHKKPATATETVREKRGAFGTILGKIGLLPKHEKPPVQESAFEYDRPFEKDRTLALRQLDESDYVHIETEEGSRLVFIKDARCVGRHEYADDYPVLREILTREEKEKNYEPMIIDKSLKLGNKISNNEQMLTIKKIEVKHDRGEDSAMNKDPVTRYKMGQGGNFSESGFIISNRTKSQSENGNPTLPSLS
jgi:hypothetical protein